MKRLLFFFIIIVHSTAFGQQLITERFSEASLEEVFDVLETKYNMKIAYDPSLIKNVKVSVSLTKATPENAFREILRNSQLTFSRVNSNYYTIAPSKNKWKIEGQIVDENGAGIPYVKLRIRNTYRGTYSDVDGRYTLEFKADQSPILELTSLGYKPITISADALINKKRFPMVPAISDYPEMVVEYLTQGISISDDVSSISIRPQELGAVPGTTEPDVFQLVQNIPGINSASSTVNEIQIRGGTADQNQLLWDGIPVYHPGHFSGMISSINPNIVQKVDLHRGVYDPYFGGKASGLINLHSLDYIPKRTIAAAGINLLQGDAYVVVPVHPKLAIMASGRRSYVDLWESPTYRRYSERVYQETEVLASGSYEQEPEFSGASGDFLDVSNEFVYYDLNGKIIYKPDSANLITASAIYTKNNLFYSTLLERNNEQHNTELLSSNVGAGIHWERTWNKRWSSDVRANYAEYAYAFSTELKAEEDSLILEERAEKSNAVNHFGFNWMNTFRVNDYHALNFGYQFARNNVDFRLFSSEEEDSVTQLGSNRASLNALHVNYTFNKNKWLLKLGVRASHFSASDEFFLEPRLYGQYRLTENLALKTSFGMQRQFISQVDQFDESQLGLSNRVWVMSDGDEIPNVSSTIGDLGFTWQKKGWYIELEAYYKQLYDIVLFSDNPSLSSGLIRGDATARGIDLLVKKRWKNLRSWISYSLGGVQYLFPELSQDAFRAPFNQVHQIKWVNTYSWRQFELSASFRIASGKPYTPIIGLISTDNTDPEAELDELFEIEYDKLNSKSLPVFHQLDITFLYTFPKSPEKHWRMKVGVSCFNVYNYNNVLSRFFDLDINEEDEENPQLETYALDRYYLGITPNALLRIEFD